jgi:membrane-bound lytic murein transglycosylase A
MRRYFVLALFLLTACAGGGSDETVLTPVAFNEVPGWSRDHPSEAFPVFQKSCQVNLRRGYQWRTKTGEPVGDPKAWRHVCQQALKLQAPTDAEARHFFERYFDPYLVTTGREPKGQMTGYYEPLLHGSVRREGAYQTPVYGVPSSNKNASREQIANGALNGRAPVLLYVDDPVMLFFLHIQGSGKVRMTDGSMMGLQYAAQNGHQYVPIGRVLKDMGELETVSMQTIRDWLRAHPGAPADAVMNSNPSYIYFKLSPGGEYAKGALGLSLTPLRSIAIDDDRAAYGVPTYISTTRTNYYMRFPESMRRLFVSQDTGGALKGPHRADIFFGRGEEEEWSAGHQNSRGKVYWLLPSISVPDSLLGL